MEIEVNANGRLVLKKVFVGIELITEDGETLSICMRDSGFEFNYDNMWYEAKNGEIKKLT